MQHQRSFFRRAWLIASVGFVAFALPGCGEGDDASVAIEKAAVVLNSLGAGGSNAITASPERRSSYQGIISSLASAAASDSPARAAAANILIARGHAGLGELAALEAAEAEARWLADAAQVSSLFASGLSQRATADALASFDPTPVLAQLDDQIRQREAEAARALAAKQKQVEVVAAIRAKAEQARARVQAERRREAEVRARAQGVSQTAKAQIIEEATEIKRRGDEFEKQAASFDADAAREAPEIDALQLMADNLAGQVELLRQDKHANAQRAEANRAQAAIAANEANQTFDRLAQAFAALTSARPAVDQFSETASRAYQQAIASAKKAASGGKDVRSSASMLQGSGQQALGDLLASRYRSLSAYAALAESLARSGKGGVSADAARSARQAADSARAEAIQAFRTAMDLYSAAKSGGAASKELNDRLDRLAERLSILSQDGDKPAPAEADPLEASADMPPAAAATDTPPTAPPADFDSASAEAAARDALCRTFDLIKARDFRGAIALAHFETDADREVALALADTLAAGSSLNSACSEKFHKDLAAMLAESQNPQLRGMAPMLAPLTGADMLDKVTRADCTKVRIEVHSASHVTVFDDPDDPELPTSFRNVDGRWLAVPGDTDFGKTVMQQVKAMKPMLAALAPALQRMADNVRSGQIADAAALERDLGAAFLAAMMRAGGGGPGGTGRPGGGGGAGGGGGDGGG